MGLIGWAGMLPACRYDAQKQAQQLCRRAGELADTDQVASLQLIRRVWEQMPTTGTPAAQQCGRQVRERMGKVRALVEHDDVGRESTIAACTWLADALDAFAGCERPPFRRHWTPPLAKRCLDVVGRAWARAPDSNTFSALTERLKKYQEKKNTL